MAAWLSTVNDLLCIRRVTDPMRVTYCDDLPVLRLKGLKMRTSTLGWLSRASHAEIPPGKIHVVDQQANPDPPVGRLEQLPGQ